MRTPSRSWSPTPITTEGDPVLLAVDGAAAESHDACAAFLRDLVARGLRAPLLTVSDGGAGLIGALDQILSDQLPADAAKARDHWKSHLDVDHDTLNAMLAALRLRTGRAHNAEAERADTLMWGHGLATGQVAIANGVALVREWVQERWRRRDVETLALIVAERCERAADLGALLIVEAIDDDPHPEDATGRLRWVERYAGDDPNSRRQLTDSDDWRDVIGPDIDTVARRLRDAGHRRVIVRGALRLPVWFAVGASLRHVHGIDVAAVQHGDIWSSDTATGTVPVPQSDVIHCGAGEDLAVAVGVATDPTTGVRAHIDRCGLPVDRLLVLTPPGGVGPQAVADGPAAARLAVGLRDAIRHQLEARPSGHIHLFMAIPGGLGLLLGHRWSTLRKTTVYEHLGVGVGYAPTFNIRA